MLMRGTQQHTRQQLEDELTRLKATLNVGGNADGVTVSLQTTRENLPAVLRLAAEVLQQPAFPADQLDEIKRNQLARIESSRTDPGPLSGMAVRRYISPYPPNDFRYAQTFDEEADSVRKVTVADLTAFHKEFYGVGAAEVGVVGSFDDAATGKLIGELFGSWKSPAPYERAQNESKVIVGKTETIETPDKTNAEYESVGLLKVRDDNVDYPSLVVGNAILGGGFLSSRLATRIRQHDGLSYSVGSQLSADALDPVGSFEIYAISAPQNTAKVDTDARDELTRFLAGPVTAAEISGASSGLLQERILGRSGDGALAGQLARHLYLGRDFTWDARFEKALAAVTADSIQKALHTYVDPKAMITVKAGDFAKAAP
jgi:zinc protease